jgi:hypothetical protein
MKSLILLASTAMAVASLLALTEPGAAVVRHGAAPPRPSQRERQPQHERPPHRVGYHGGVYRGAWVGRPYRWATGGAIAAGAAVAWRPRHPSRAFAGTTPTRASGAASGTPAPELARLTGSGKC